MKTQKHFNGIIAFFLILSFGSCTKDDAGMNPQNQTNLSVEDMIRENGQNPDEKDLQPESINRWGQRGFVYTESNASTGNNILVYERNNGTFSLKASVSANGNGSGDALGSQGAIKFSDDHQYLFAVNAGSNSISSFKVNIDGSLDYIDSVDSRGEKPISIAIHENHLYVVNAESDNISGYKIGNGGILSHIPGAIRTLSATGADPAQISFSPNGHYLMVTEKATNKITTYDIDQDGIPSNKSARLATGTTPFGFAISRNLFMVVSNASGGASGASTVTSYSGINTGVLRAENGAVANNQSASCWVGLSKHGTLAFISNTGSDNISSYYVAPWGSIYLINAAINSGAAPADIAVAENNYNVYVICGGDHTIQMYNRTLLGGLTHTGELTGLPDFASGLAVH